MVNIINMELFKNEDGYYEFKDKTVNFRLVSLMILHEENKERTGKFKIYAKQGYKYIEIRSLDIGKGSFNCYDIVDQPDWIDVRFITKEDTYFKIECEDEDKSTLYAVIEERELFQCQVDYWRNKV